MWVLPAKHAGPGAGPPPDCLALGSGVRQGAGDQSLICAKDSMAVVRSVVKRLQSVTNARIDQPPGLSELPSTGLSHDRHTGNKKIRIGRLATFLCLCPAQAVIGHRQSEPREKKQEDSALRPEFTRGLGAIRVDGSDAGQVLGLIKALPRRPRYRSSGAVVTSGSRLNVQFLQTEE